MASCIRVAVGNWGKIELADGPSTSAGVDETSVELSSALLFDFRSIAIYRQTAIS
jgi:hypothetical protein